MNHLKMESLCEITYQVRLGQLIKWNSTKQEKRAIGNAGKEY